MIEFLKTPYQCSYSKNEIVFKVSSNMYFKSIGAFPSVQLTVNSLPTAGEHYILDYEDPITGNNKTMRLVSAPTYTEAWEIPDNTFAGTIEEFTDIVLDKLQNYVHFNGYYVCTKTDTNKILIAADVADEALVPAWSTNQAAVRIDSVVDVSIIDPEIRTGYKMKAVVYFEKEYLSGDFESVSEIDCPLDQNAEFYADLSDILNAEIERSWDEYPVPFEKGNQFKASNLRRYYIEFTESWSGETKQNSLKSETMFVHWGGVSVDDQQIADPVYLNSNLNNFLTWWPSGKRITREQDDWLSWMNPFHEMEIKIRLKIYTDAGTNTYTIFSTNMKTWETLTFNTSFLVNNIQTLAGAANVSKWSFMMLNYVDKAVSPEFIYYPDDTKCIFKTIVYFNSFGMPECFNTSGDWKENMNCSTSVARRSKSFELNALFPQSFVFNSTHQNSFNAISGVLKNDEALRLQPLLNSTISFLQDGERWIPIIISVNKASLITLNEFVTRIEMEILKANSNDRASFYDLMPDVVVVQNCGVEKFTIDANGLDLTTYGSMKIYKNGAVLETVAWDGGQQAYIPSATITDKAHYRVECTIDDYEIIKHFDYSPMRITAINNQSGAVQFALRSTSIVATIDVDWGDGGGFQTEMYWDALSNIPHTYTASGKKEIVLQKACFDDIIEFHATEMEVNGIDLSKMKNLQVINLQQAVEGNMYFSQFKKLKQITLANQNVYGLEIGFQKDLQIVQLSNIPITSENLDKLFLELWKYRKFYSNDPATPGVYCTSIITPSALVTSIVNGTGIYAGEGLVTDYGWTVVFI